MSSQVTSVSSNNDIKINELLDNNTKRGKSSKSYKRSKGSSKTSGKHSGKSSGKSSG